MKFQRYWGAFALAILGLAALGITKLAGEARPPQMMPEAPDAAKPESRTDGYQLKVGQVQTMQASFHSEGAFALQLLASPNRNQPLVPAPFVVKVIDEQLQLLVLDVNKNGTLVLLRGQAPSLELGRPGPNPTPAGPEWLGGVYATIKPQGGLDQVLDVIPAAPLANAYYRMLLASMFPELDGQNLRSPIPGGILLSDNLSQSLGNGRITEVKYRGFVPDSSRLKGQVQGQAKVHYDNGIVHKLDLDRRLSQQLGQQTLGEEQLKISIVAAGSHTLSEAELSQHRQQRSTSSKLAKDGYHGAKVALAKKRVGDKTFAQAAEDFFATRPSNLADEPQTYEMLKAWLVLEPWRSEEIVAWLDQLAPEDPRYDLVGVLLANAEGEVGQRLLVERITRDLENPKRVAKLAFSLALVEEPSAYTQQAARRWLDATQARPESYLELAPYAAAIGFRSDAKIRAAMAESINAYGLSHNDDAIRAQSAVALGNLGYEQTMDLVGGWLESSNQVMRLRAVTALRRVQGSTSSAATSALAMHALHDEAPEVRREAAASLHTRPLDNDLISAIERQLMREKDPAVVIKLLQAVASGTHDKPRVRQILMDVNAQCGHPAICRKIEGLLLVLQQES